MLLHAAVKPVQKVDPLSTWELTFAIDLAENCESRKRRIKNLTEVNLQWLAHSD